MTRPTNRLKPGASFELIHSLYLIIMSATNTWLSKVVGAWTHATSCNIISFMANLANSGCGHEGTSLFDTSATIQSGNISRLSTPLRCREVLQPVAGINPETYIGYDGSLYQQMDG